MDGFNRIKASSSWLFYIIAEFSFLRNNIVLNRADSTYCLYVNISNSKVEYFFRIIHLTVSKW